MFSKYNKLLTMKSICFSKWSISILRVELFFFLISVGVPPQWWNFDVEKTDVFIFLLILECSPLDNVAHSVSQCLSSTVNY